MIFDYIFFSDIADSEAEIESQMPPPEITDKEVCIQNNKGNVFKIKRKSLRHGR